MQKPFFFIGNIIETDLNTPIQILDGFEIKRANPDQIRIIKSRLNRFQEVSQDMTFSVNSYECEFIKERDRKSVRIKHLKDQKDWKYWILEIDLTINDISKNHDFIMDNIRIIDKAFLLAESGIYLLWGFLHYHISENEIHIDDFSSFGYRPINFFKSQGPWYTEKTHIDKPFIDEVKYLISRIEVLSSKNEYLQFRKSLNDIANLFEIPAYSPYRIIGLFAILEYLFTSNDSSKSINKQLQTKLNLMNNRITEGINANEFFKIPKAFTFEKIIEKLYAYRSDIAHGNPIDFENKLQVLNNSQLVEKFLLKLVNKIFKQTLIEPDLVIDLKKC